MQNDGSQKGTLNAILHGAFAFVRDDKRNQLRALIPAMDYHVYRAGSWLAETELQGARTRQTDKGSKENKHRDPKRNKHKSLKGTDNKDSHGIEYELKGVSATTPNAVWFDHQKNLILKGVHPSVEGLFATPIFPLPKKIASLRVANIPRDAFIDPDDSSHMTAARAKLAVDDATQHVATLQVLTYDIDDPNDLALQAFNVDLRGEQRRKPTDGHYWEPVFNGNYVNLHIFSSEDQYHKPSNSGEDLNRCIRQLGVDLAVNTNVVRVEPGVELHPQLVPGGIEQDELPIGVQPQETESLMVRNLRMARLGRLVLNKGDANLAWYGNDALDSMGEACGSVGS